MCIIVRLLLWVTISFHSFRAMARGWTPGVVPHPQWKKSFDTFVGTPISGYYNDFAIWRLHILQRLKTIDQLDESDVMNNMNIVYSSLKIIFILKWIMWQARYRQNRWNKNGYLYLGYFWALNPRFFNFMQKINPVLFNWKVWDNIYR